MAEIKLIRIDYRLVHGQVATQWVRLSGANRIVVANDELAADSFMADIYRMAAPQGIRVDIKSVAEFCESWRTDECGAGKLLVIFKNFDDAMRAYEDGFTCEDIQIGNLGGGGERVPAPCGVTFDAHDVELARKLIASGVHVHIQVVPSSSDLEFEKAINGLNL